MHDLSADTGGARNNYQPPRVLGAIDHRSLARLNQLYTRYQRETLSGEDGWCWPPCRWPGWSEPPTRIHLVKHQLSLIDLWPGAGDGAQKATEQLMDGRALLARHTPAAAAGSVVKFPNSLSRTGCRSRGLSKGNGGAVRVSYSVRTTSHRADRKHRTRAWQQAEHRAGNVGPGTPGRPWLGACGQADVRDYP